MELHWIKLDNISTKIPIFNWQTSSSIFNFFWQSFVVWVHWSCEYIDKFTSKYLPLMVMQKLILFSIFPMLICINAVDFCSLNFYLIILLNLLFPSISIALLLQFKIVFFFLVSLLWLEPPVQCSTEVKTDILAFWSQGGRSPIFHPEI